MTQPVDSSILHEIVRVINSRRKVPDKVIVASKEYLLTYLEDHRHRLEEALMRFDGDRLNMLYGQLASKVKYQLLRRVPARAAAAMGLSTAKAARPAAKPEAPAKRPAKPAAKATPAKPAAKPAPARKAAKATAAKKKPVAAKKKAVAPKKAKVAPRRAAARPKKKARR
ncbi:MAG: hypothetical protein U0802_07810 [Candidatus Binatia bacterium]